MMKRFISEQDWKPVGVDVLEPNAECVVRSGRNMLVVAGPGAGKTELLAQRANFLLTTGRCPPPRRILAISFKTDAASNLEKRVRERCGDSARRFDSMTLDAFAKSLVDRFRIGLPEDWRPRAEYLIRVSPYRPQEAREWMRTAPVPNGMTRPEVEYWSNAQVTTALAKIAHGARLPYNNAVIRPLHRHWGRWFWRGVLSASPDTPSLTFSMLNRLAAYLLRCNPRIVDALRSTYAYLFMDEFQDTTEAQWDLVLSAFQGSGTIVTAVGDDKQRIMRWAGAMPDAFDRFGEVFEAERIPLLRNYRSAPQLVRIQDQIARAMLGEGSATEAAGRKADTGSCVIWRFPTAEAEAEFIATWIAQQVQRGGKCSNDFCILARQHVGQIIQPLQAALAFRDLRLQDESLLRDLRVEPVSRIVVNAIRLAVQQRDPEAWITLLEELAYAAGLDEDDAGPGLERLAVKHRSAARQSFEADGGNLVEAVRRVVDVLGASRYRQAYPQYTAANFERVMGLLEKALQDSLHRTGDVLLAVDEFLGKDVIPAMTIHKSKGLEFDTVIFLGLEDRLWWNFPNQPDEEKRAFFVAFSRAIRQVIFTYSELRPSPKDGSEAPQARKNIRSLYEVLQEAGVRVVSPLDGEE